MKRFLITVLLCVLASSTVVADVRKRTVDGGSIASPCHLEDSKLECAISLRSGGHPFGVAIKAKQAYTLDKIWLRVRRQNGSGAKDLLTHYDDVTAGNFALMQFHAEDVASKLGLSMTDLQKEGFQVRPKIESLGVGAGRQDKCAVVSFRYVEEEYPGWTWVKGGAAPNDAFKAMGNDFTVLYKSGGSVNDVKCRFDRAGSS